MIHPTRSFRSLISGTALGLLAASAVFAASAPLAPMLNLATTGQDADKIDYNTLPVLKGEHALITAGPHQLDERLATVFDRADLNDPDKWNFRLHSYLAYHDGKYWAMWSHGRVVEDHPTQHLRYSTSVDGLKWSEPKIIAPSPEKDGFRYISRGLWVRDGKLIALAGLDEAYGFRGAKEGNGKEKEVDQLLRSGLSKEEVATRVGLSVETVKQFGVRFFGASLTLQAFEWQPKEQTWKPLGAIADKAINNFAPAKMPNGEWGMICRGTNYDRDVFMLTGGVKSVADWKRSPIVTEISVVQAAPSAGEKGDTRVFRPEEPDWWTLPDGRLLGLFRDNGRSGRFFRGTSSDNGHTWSSLEKTNFPDATSKFFCLRTSKGFYVMVNNAFPKYRNPLCLSTSDDGVTFTRMAQLPIPVKREGGEFDAAHKGGTVQYPHVIEHDGNIMVIYSRNKTAIETIKVSLAEIEKLRAGKL